MLSDMPLAERKSKAYFTHPRYIKVWQFVVLLSRQQIFTIVFDDLFPFTPSELHVFIVSTFLLASVHSHMFLINFIDFTWELFSFWSGLLSHTVTAILLFSRAPIHCNRIANHCRTLLILKTFNLLSILKVIHQFKLNTLKPAYSMKFIHTFALHSQCDKVLMRVFSLYLDVKSQFITFTL